MSSKFDVLMKIINSLNSKQPLTVHSIMDEHAISQRSVFRYMGALNDAGFPIEFDKKRGSYRFVDDYCLSKPNITTKEHLALSLARTELAKFGSEMEDQIDKITQKLTVKNKAVTKHIIVKGTKLTKVSEPMFQTLSEAIEDHKKVHITYQALHSNKVTQRDVDPYYLYFHDGIWLLRGYCHLRQTFRTFALDKMQAVTISGKYFAPKRTALEDEISDAFFAVVDGEKFDVVLRFDKPIQPYVLRNKWHISQTEKPLKDGRVELRFTVVGLDEIKAWIYRWLPYVEVVSPPELREVLVSDLNATLKLHQATKAGNK